MALRVDRLLETCYKRGTEMLWVAGSPPLIRDEAGLRQMQIPPLTAADVATLIEQIRPSPERVQEGVGYVWYDLTYGEACVFRTYIFAATSFVLLVKLDPSKISTKWN